MSIVSSGAADSSRVSLDASTKVSNIKDLWQALQKQDKNNNNKNKPVAVPSDQPFLNGQGGGASSNFFSVVTFTVFLQHQHWVIPVPDRQIHPRGARMHGKTVVCSGDGRNTSVTKEIKPFKVIPVPVWSSCVCWIEEDRIGCKYFKFLQVFAGKKSQGEPPRTCSHWEWEDVVCFVNVVISISVRQAEHPNRAQFSEIKQWAFVENLPGIQESLRYQSSLRWKGADSEKRECFTRQRQNTL